MSDQVQNPQNPSDGPIVDTSGGRTSRTSVGETISTGVLDFLFRDLNTDSTVYNSNRLPPNTNPVYTRDKHGPYITSMSRLTEEESQQTSVLVNEAGALEMKQDVYKGQDNSYVMLMNKTRSGMVLNDAAVTIKGTSDVSINSDNNMFAAVGGDMQWVVQGDQHHFTAGNETRQGGEANQEQVDSAVEAQKIAHDIDKKKIDTIKNTKGSEVECPTCAMEVATDRGQCLLDLVFALIRYAIPNFPYPLDIIEKILNFLGIPMMTPETVKTLNGGEGCGSPGCKGGSVTTPQEGIQQANEQAAGELKSKQKELGELSKKMGAGGAQVMGPFTGDFALYVGNPQAINRSPTVAVTDHYGTIPFGHTNEQSGMGFIPNSKGNCKKAVYSDPLILPGSFTLGVGQKVNISAGSPGIEAKTSGKLTLTGAWTILWASEGEMWVGSKNVTHIAGKNIIIDANDQTGDSGIYLDAERTKCKGALHVDGDFSVKGHIAMDGGLTTTHITCPGERVSTGPSGPAHQVHSNGTWNNPILGLQATIFDQYDKGYKKISRDVFNVLSLNIINGMAEIKTLIEEAYSSIMIAAIIDNFGMPTGFGTAYFALPGEPLGPPLLVNGIAHVELLGFKLPVIFDYTFVIPGQTFPIYTFTHNHGSPGSNHAHDYTSFQGQPVANNQSARAARPNPSHVPSPPKATGIGSKPGHKNAGELCIPCIWPFGGDGTNTKTRNQSYGLDPNAGNNVFTDGQGNPTNYVPVTSFNFYTSGGNLVTPPFFDLGCDPNTGLPYAR